jgi:hypothetical protein
MTRTPSPLTLALVAAMATDPRASAALRKFHAAQLADLERRASRARDRRPSPFTRFIEKLETETTEP